MNNKPFALLILLLLPFSVFGWSEDCEKQFQESIEEECKVIDCMELDEGR